MNTRLKNNHFKSTSYSSLVSKLLGNWPGRIVSLVILLLVVFFLVRAFSSNSSQDGSMETSNKSIDVVSDAVPVNRIFNFQARDVDGNTVEQILSLGFIDVQRKDEILIQGQRAQARNEKSFLVFNIAVRNDTGEVLFLDPVDLVRWVESETDLIAPQVTQGNLEVRPQSTKKSNLGFVVPVDQKDFRIQVGELSEEKEFFDINL